MRRPRLHAPVAIPILVLALPLLSCDDEGTGPPLVATVREPFEFERDVAVRDALRLLGVNGDMTVSGTSPDETARVSGFRRVTGCPQSRAEEVMAELQVRITESGEELVIQTLQPTDTSPCTAEVRYELAIPPRLAVWLADVNGAIDVSGLLAGVSVTGVNGDVTLDDVEGGASVRLTNGGITAGVRLAGDERVDLLTVNGAVDVTIPATTGARVWATLVTGTIRIQNLTMLDQVRGPTSLAGTLGDGEGEILLHTTNGNITLTGR